MATVRVNYVPETAQLVRADDGLFSVTIPEVWTDVQDQDRYLTLCTAQFDTDYDDEGNPSVAQDRIIVVYPNGFAETIAVDQLPQV